MLACQYNQSKRPGDLDLESGVRARVTCATSVSILVFLGLSVLELRPMYATDRRQTKASLNAPPIRGGDIRTTRRKVHSVEIPIHHADSKGKVALDDITLGLA